MAYKAQGWSGLKGKTKLQEDVKKLKDKNRQRKKLEATVDDNKKRLKAGKGARTVSQRDIEAVVDKFRSTKQKIRRLQGRAAEMRDRANAVDRSGTGNKRAAATYRKVADELVARIKVMRGRK